MSLKCPFCGARHAVANPWRERVILCRCGGRLFGPALMPRMPREVSARWEEEERVRRLQQRAERICALILRPDYPEVDIAIERAELRAECARIFPDRLDLYDMIYENRFRRLWKQFREPIDG